VAEFDSLGSLWAGVVNKVSGLAGSDQAVIDTVWYGRTVTGVDVAVANEVLTLTLDTYLALDESDPLEFVFSCPVPDDTIQGLISFLAEPNSRRAAVSLSGVGSTSASDPAMRMLWNNGIAGTIRGELLGHAFPSLTATGVSITVEDGVSDGVLFRGHHLVRQYLETEVSLVDGGPLGAKMLQGTILAAVDVCASYFFYEDILGGDKVVPTTVSQVMALRDLLTWPSAGEGVWGGEEIDALHTYAEAMAAAAERTGILRTRAGKSIIAMTGAAAELPPREFTSASALERMEAAMRGFAAVDIALTNDDNVTVIPADGVLIRGNKNQTR